jgi:hypothetical protein
MLKENKGLYHRRHKIPYRKRIFVTKILSFANIIYNKSNLKIHNKEMHTPERYQWNFH